VDVARVLVVEDEASVRMGLRLGLEGRGFHVIEAENAAQAWPRLAECDVVVLDWMLPDEPGVRFLERLRKSEAYADLPVLILTAKAREVDRVEGLERGADDYLTKPFSLAELAARLKALLRRSGRKNRLVFGALILDLEAAEVHLGGQKVGLTRREFDLLVFLARHPGRVFDRETLLDAVWGVEYFGTPRTVDQHVAQLREKLGPSWIETVRGRGYRFRGEES